MKSRHPLWCGGMVSFMLWFSGVESGYAQMAAQETEAADSKPHYTASYSTAGILSNSSAAHSPPSSSSSKDADNQLKVYQYKQDNGVMAFSDHAPGAAEYQVLLYDCYACQLDSSLDWKKIPLFSRDYDELINHAANTHNLEPALIRAVIHAESAFNVFALSRTGAMGLMQLMPETAIELGVKNAFKPEQNIAGGAKYLAQMLKRFDGDIDLACAAYNAGATNVIHYKGIPPYPETQAYVKRVKILLERYRKPG